MKIRCRLLCYLFYSWTRSKNWKNHSNDHQNAKIFFQGCLRLCLLSRLAWFLCNSTRHAGAGLEFHGVSPLKLSWPDTPICCFRVIKRTKSCMNVLNFGVFWKNLSDSTVNYTRMMIFSLSVFRVADTLSLLKNRQKSEESEAKGVKF